MMEGMYASKYQKKEVSNNLSMSLVYILGFILYLLVWCFQYNSFNNGQIMVWTECHEILVNRFAKIGSIFTVLQIWEKILNENCLE